MEHIGRQLKRIHMITERNFNSVVSHYDLTTAQADVLILLFRSRNTPVFQKDIETILNLKNPTVTGTLKRLESKGFIQRIPLATDRRFNQILPTQRAWELDTELLRTFHDSSTQMLSGFTPDEQRTLNEYLKRIIDNLTQQGGKT